jgi:hypothetical protein
MTAKPPDLQCGQGEMPTPADTVRTYILAKDGNRPFMMRRAFTPDAALEMTVKTDAIAFPSAARGLDAIEDVLVRRFCVDYEDVFTFCLSKPPVKQGTHFACHWLVGMSAKSDGRLRVGCGRYEWRFDNQGLAEKLAIIIVVMKVLPASERTVIMDWFSALPYPWCSADQALAGMPASPGLGEIEAYLKQVGHG